MGIPGTNNLLERCKKNEDLAFKELYGMYARAMFNVSMRIVNNKDEAEDILQESFVKAFRDMKRFETLPAFASWIKKVVINGSLDAVRRKKFDLVSMDEDTEAADLPEENEEPNYDINTIVQCVSELPAGYRIILTLFLFEEYSHKQIAESLNISEGTSKSQYNRAKKKLIELILKKNTINA
jgi:RNA polymerase sigma-70 factor (ECF subfamily)